MMLQAIAMLPSKPDQNFDNLFDHKTSTGNQCTANIVKLTDFMSVSINLSWDFVRRKLFILLSK